MATLSAWVGETVTIGGHEITITYRNGFVLWQHLEQDIHGRIPRPELSELSIGDARELWHGSVFGPVTPSSGFDGHPVGEHTPDSGKWVVPATELILTAAAIEYLVTGGGDPLFTNDGDRLYVEIP